MKCIKLPGIFIDSGLILYHQGQEIINFAFKIRF